MIKKINSIILSLFLYIKLILNIFSIFFDRM